MVLRTSGRVGSRRLLKAPGRNPGGFSVYTAGASGIPGRFCEDGCRPGRACGVNFTCLEFEPETHAETDLARERVPGMSFEPADEVIRGNRDFMVSRINFTISTQFLYYSLESLYF